MGKPSDLVQGTLDLLILKTISLEPKHGWAIAKRIQQISNEVLQVQQGSLYPALHRLEQSQMGGNRHRKASQVLFVDRHGTRPVGEGGGQLEPTVRRDQSGR